MKLNLDEAKKYSYPFPYAIIKNPFGEEDEIEDSFPSMDNITSSIRMDKDMTYPSDNYLNLLANSRTYSDLHNTIYSTYFVEEFIQLFKDEILENVNDQKLLVNPLSCNIVSTPLETFIQSYGERKHETKINSFLYPRLDIGVGGKGYGLYNGGGGIHTDNETRLISILYYVNTPKNIDGGDHRLYEIVNQKPKIHKAFAPNKGLMIASIQSNYALHDVDPILNIQGYRKALYMAISCNNSLWATGEDWLMQLTASRIKKPANPIAPFKQRIKSSLKTILRLFSH